MRTVITDWEIWHRAKKRPLPHQPEYYEVLSTITGQWGLRVPVGAIVLAQRTGKRLAAVPLKSGARRIVEVDLVNLDIIREA